MNRYKDVKRFTENGIQIVATADLPDIDEKNTDILLIATQGDRCDLISQQYYGTPDFWWFIASINKLKSNNIEAGTQLRVPVSLDSAVLK